MEKYMNLYYCAGSNELVSGKNVYNSKEEAESKQNCPAGYIYHGVVKLRNW